MLFASLALFATVAVRLIFPVLPPLFVTAALPFQDGHKEPVAKIKFGISSQKAASFLVRVQAPPRPGWDTHLGLEGSLVAHNCPNDLLILLWGSRAGRVDDLLHVREGQGVAQEARLHRRQALQPLCAHVGFPFAIDHT